MLSSAKTDAPPRSKCARLFVSTYSLANIIYICYAVLIVVINLFVSKQAEISSPGLLIVPAADDYGYYEKAQTAVFRQWVSRRIRKTPRAIRDPNLKPH